MNFSERSGGFPDISTFRMVKIATIIIASLRCILVVTASTSTTITSLALLFNFTSLVVSLVEHCHKTQVCQDTKIQLGNWRLHPVAPSTRK